MLNINENMLMEFMMANVNLFDSITQLVIRSPAVHGYDTCLLLALLLQYHKYDVRTTYRQRVPTNGCRLDVEHLHRAIFHLRR